MVFVKIYTGTIHARDVVQVLSTPSFGWIMNEETSIIRKERIGGMLELAGGRFRTFDLSNVKVLVYMCIKWIKKCRNR